MRRRNAISIRLMYTRYRQTLCRKLLLCPSRRVASLRTCIFSLAHTRKLYLLRLPDPLLLLLVFVVVVVPLFIEMIEHPIRPRFRVGILVRGSDANPRPHGGYRQIRQIFFSTFFRRQTSASSLFIAGYSTVSFNS